MTKCIKSCLCFRILYSDFLFFVLIFFLFCNIQLNIFFRNTWKFILLNVPVLFFFINIYIDDRSVTLNTKCVIYSNANFSLNPIKLGFKTHLNVFSSQGNTWYKIL